MKIMGLMGLMGLRELGLWSIYGVVQYESKLVKCFSKNFVDFRASSQTVP